MKKIVILSDIGEPRYDLVSNLEELFPECEIQIIQRHPENMEDDIINKPIFISQPRGRRT